MNLSIIIPAYNEEKNIIKTISELENFLSKNLSDLDSEIIIVSDGSTDNTFQTALNHNSKKIKIFHYQDNKGKGYALKYGFEKSKGDLVFFLDAGGDFHPEEIKKFIVYLKVNNADVVVGSKRHPLSKVNYPLKRKFLSKIAQLWTKLIFSLDVKDTQAGIKLFKRKTLEKTLFKTETNGFAFDIELLTLVSLKGFKIIEAPIILNYNFSGTSIDWKAYWQTFLDTFKIWRKIKNRKEFKE